ncbi:amidohydrolase family protein [Actinomyces naeslundii str. Howell 279]|uniref:Amidohydrolase family protein n=1 Tax=Actinomyces naeslundii (strain ATCC 12104 / DSM 43013 / CCUG 2238 / JCM 8349 / NCTC 10301 / Howell 279) TaxID=1115803 RepID=J3F4Q0_ACTNH|nr:amidohydrolase family protein [Actinomyces naeslundii str. Howell 279]
MRVTGGRVVEVGRGLHAPGAPVLQADGSFLIPGLWDAHAHLDMEAARSARIDTLATRSAEEALELVARSLRDLPAGSQPATIQGFGHRLSNWPRLPTVAELDAVTGDIPTLLISGDVHSGWLNSAALRIFGLPQASAQEPGAPLKEDPWFALLDRLDEVPGTRELRESGYQQVLADMLARGVTGVVDMSWSEDPDDWPRRLQAMETQGVLPEVLPRIRVAVYRDKLEHWIARGLRTGTELAGSPHLPDGSPVLVQGPLKVIADGSMGSGSAHMCEPYPAELGLEHACGVVNIDRAELTDLMARAGRQGYEMAIHAIGDAAVDDVAAAFALSGAAGRLEHAQLLPADALDEPNGALRRLVGCGVELSVQPAHLIDDWTAVGRVWAGPGGAHLRVRGHGGRRGSAAAGLGRAGGAAGPVAGDGGSGGARDAGRLGVVIGPAAHSRGGPGGQRQRGRTGGGGFSGRSGAPGRGSPAPGGRGSGPGASTGHDRGRCRRPSAHLTRRAATPGAQTSRA